MRRDRLPSPHADAPPADEGSSAFPHRSFPCGDALCSSSTKLRISTPRCRQLRLLLNFETDDAKLLQIVLVGHPELNQTLRHHAPQLDERVARRCELHPLSDAEIAPAIDHRLSMAQQLSRLSEVTIFDSDDGCARRRCRASPSPRPPSV